ncbi:MAG TPA: nuclear transport factor 2 family protein, partial [Longimicrobium sp.]|nr:nuclear transport factor 2 family protein [Longimicrobium sp.]
ACAHAPVPGQDAIARELDDFHDAAAQADEARYFAHFAPDGVFLGTDATERWDVQAFRAYSHPYFAKGKAWTFHGVRRRIAVRGDVAWFEEDLETQNLGPARGSGVLVFSGGRWLIEQYVLSITVPNEKFKAVRELLQ